MLPWCCRFTPQPDSLPAGSAHQRSEKFGVAGRLPPAAHVGCGLANTCRVMGLDWVTPFTVYENVPLFASVKLNVAVPTCVTWTALGLNGCALNAGPVVVYKAPVYVSVAAPACFSPSDITSQMPLLLES